MLSFSSVSVSAPARLHMGFLDLSGSLQRHFGSIGVALNVPVTRLVMKHAPQRKITGIENNRLDKYLTLFCNVLGVPDTLHIELTHVIPSHIGLGSGTQMAIAIGTGLNAFYDLNLSVRDIAALMDRGLRS
ncbi:MAG: GHMP kinase, partial [Methylococcaceae bacterium]